ncbi:cupin domain-containing protein [Taklimakanibacter lacteus]|uniref:cupin domain-containing protein n=1 Tax=Taklimakanibacter lacteus TaxID=2268456 RepID=UPI000E6601C8
MPGKFVMAREVAAQTEDWGTLRWLSHPPSTGAGQLTVIDVGLEPGKGHDFHKHPDQEEVILVVSGKVEQWVDRDKRLLGPGDSAFIPADVVHASFNVADTPARIVAILGPCVGPMGYELVDVAKDASWKTLRAQG